MTNNENTLSDDCGKERQQVADREPADELDFLSTVEPKMQTAPDKDPLAPGYGPETFVAESEDPMIGPTVVSPPATAAATT